MKIRLTFFASLIILLAIACKNTANTNTTTTTADSTAAALAMMTDTMLTAAMAMDTMHTAMIMDSTNSYVCPMHADATGKKGDKCPKCKMDLVAKAEAKKAADQKKAADLKKKNDLKNGVNIKKNEEEKTPVINPKDSTKNYCLSRSQRAF